MVDFPNGPLIGEVFTANGVSYTYDGEKWTTSGVAGGTQYLPLAGGTMTGFILHSADPTDPLHTATKQYSDLKVIRAGDTMTGLLSLSNDPTLPLHAVPKRYMDKVVGALVAGADLVGLYDATLGEIRWNADQPHTGHILPTPAPELKGHFIMCAVEGTNPPQPAVSEQHMGGDWLVCDGVAEWLHIYIATRIEAPQVPTNPAVAGQADVQAALEVMVPVSGAVMSGSLSLNADPTALLHAAPKQYVDAADALGVKKAGDTMTGFLTLSGSPTSPMHASTKAYSDQHVIKAGDVMTGFLTLNADPTDPLHSATKAYVDATTSGGPPGGYVPISGGIMTGPLTLSADPASAMIAATKQYVDRHAPFTGVSPPATPVPGALWFDPNGLQLYIWFLDETGGGQWVVVINQIAATTAILKLTERVAGLELELGHVTTLIGDLTRLVQELQAGALMVDFPDAPVLDEDFAVNGVVYTYDGQKWIAQVNAATAYLPLAGGSMVGALNLFQNPLVDMEAVPKRYLEEQIAALIAGVELFGVFSAITGQIRWHSDAGFAGDTLPPPTIDLEGKFLICSDEGDYPPINAPIEHYMAGDWLVCNGVDAWYHIHIAQDFQASDIDTNPAVAGMDNVQAALEAMVPKSGATMTGFLTLNGDPTALLHSATKQYVDSRAGGVPEAPLDGVPYSRQSATWVPSPSGGGTVPEAPNDGQLYGRQSLLWAVVPTASGGGIPEAPLDGQQYARQSAAWSVVAGGGAVTVGDAAPVTPAQGALWFDSLSAQLFVHYNDGNSSQWVIAVNSGGGGGGGGTVGPQGPPGPAGPKGDTGATGPQGPKGNTGNTGPQGPAGAQGPPGTTISPSSTVPLASTGQTGVAGTATTYSRGDHRHTSDASKLSLTGGTMTGAITLPAANPTASYQAAHKAYVDSKVTGGAYLPLTGGTLSGALTINGNCTSQRHQVKSTANPIYDLLNSGGAIIGQIFSTSSYTQVSCGSSVYSQLVSAGATEFNVSPAWAAKPGGGVWNTASDARIKTVIADYALGLDAVLQLRPVTYVYKGNDTPTEDVSTPGGVKSDDVVTPVTAAPYPASMHYLPATDQKQFVGLVAQEVEAIFPEMVRQRDGFIDGQPVTDLRGLDTSSLIYALVNAVKELSAKVAALEAAAP